MTFSIKKLSFTLALSFFLSSAAIAQLQHHKPTFQTNNFNGEYKPAWNGIDVCNDTRQGGLEMNTCLPINNMTSHVIKFQIMSDKLDKNMAENTINPGKFWLAYDKSATVKSAEVKVYSQNKKAPLFDGTIKNNVGITCTDDGCVKWNKGVKQYPNH